MTNKQHRRMKEVDMDDVEHSRETQFIVKAMHLFLGMLDFCSKMRASVTAYCSCASVSQRQCTYHTHNNKTAIVVGVAFFV